MRYFVFYKDGVPTGTIKSVPDHDHPEATEVTEAEYETIFAELEAKRKKQSSDEIISTLQARLAEKEAEIASLNEMREALSILGVQT